MTAGLVESFSQPATIALTRLAPRLLDSDNAVSALKHVRDGIADALGINDGDEQVVWWYGQEKAAKHGVRVEITGGG